ncbi:MAG TPA: alpha/beta hydrolase [Candidatus Bathyarchaeia archaeon]
MIEKKLKISDRECLALASNDAGTPVMFLHGFSYTRDIWRRIGTLNALIERKIPFLALDMPYGKKSVCVPKSSDVETNEIFAFEAFKSEFGVGTPSVIVGASLGGYIALRYAARRPVKALMLVSPTRTGQQELVEPYSRFNFPVRIVWGSRDIIVSERDLREMAGRLPNAKISVYEGAGHSAYKDQPERFNRELLELYVRVK